MKKNLADMVRSVPETAVRLYLGAKVDHSNGAYVIELDGKQYSVSSETYEISVGVERALKVRERRVEYASDVLELRHDAENIFLEQLAHIEGPRILFVPAGEMASAYYRAKIPADVINEKGGALAHWTEKLDLKKAVGYDVLWVQLVVSPICIKIVEQAKGAGVKIVYDVDDRFDVVPAGNPSAALYVRDKVDQVWRMIELADIVTVSTWSLARHIAPRARDVRVLPNMIPASIWPEPTERSRGPFRILWAGSPTHKRDLAIVAPALAGFLADHKGKARFTLFGERCPEALEVVRELVDLVPFTEFSEYATALAGVCADIAIAPLEASEFNSGKSDVKFLEYSACGYPSLLSPAGQYEETAGSGAPTTLVPDDHWRDALELAINLRDELPARGEAAKTWARENRCVIKTMARQWTEVAGALVGDRNR